MTDKQGSGSSAEAKERVLIALFKDADRAKEAVETLIERDYPMDMISLLGRPYAVGDDPLGIYYHTPGERMKGWGKMGAFWGGLWGLLAGAAGLFVIPGVGPLLAAGPIVEALVGAASGAAVMAGAAAATQLTVAMRAAGIPEEKLDELHKAIEAGQFVVLFRCRAKNCPEYKATLGFTKPDELFDYPFGHLLRGVGPR